MSLPYFLINPHNPMRCHYFLSLSNEEILAQGIRDFPKASQQTSGGAGIRTLSPQAQSACFLTPHCSPSWEKSVHHKIILILIPWDAFYLLFLFYPQLLVTITPHWFLFFSFFFFVFFWATSAAYGGSQARGRIGAVATGLRQSHSNSGSKPRLQPTPQLTATPDP